VRRQAPLQALVVTISNTSGDDRNLGVAGSERLQRSTCQDHGGSNVSHCLDDAFALSALSRLILSPCAYELRYSREISSGRSL
jgi:hypothetical protein